MLKMKYETDYIYIQLIAMNVLFYKPLCISNTCSSDWTPFFTEYEHRI